MPNTRSQRMAQAAWEAVSRRPRSADYASFAKSFPALLHAAGLCQAVAFIQARPDSKAPLQVLEDVITASGLQTPVDIPRFAADARTAAVLDYMRLSRLTLMAATWVKRYAEALEVQDV